MSNNAALPIWDFVLDYYRQQGVSEAAITLQDAAGIDVNMILFLMWLSGAEQNAGRSRYAQAERRRRTAGSAASWCRSATFAAC